MNIIRDFLQDADCGIQLTVWEMLTSKAACRCIMERQGVGCLVTGFPRGKIPAGKGKSLVGQHNLRNTTFPPASRASASPPNRRPAFLIALRHHLF